MIGRDQYGIGQFMPDDGMSKNLVRKNRDQRNGKQLFAAFAVHIDSHDLVDPRRLQNGTKPRRRKALAGLAFVLAAVPKVGENGCNLAGTLLF